MEAPVKILLVDDDIRNLDALETFLEAPGCEFVRATGADQALLAILNNDFAAIVLDIKMPGTDGLELARLIKQRKRSRNVPILFLTAHRSDEKEVLQAYGVGGVDFMSKPVNPEILRSKVAVFVDLFRTTRALSSAVEALNAEVIEREKIQEELRIAKEHLENRVLERTAELARANREVRDNEERLRLALAVAQVATWEWDLATGNMRWSAQPEIVFGFPAGAFGPNLRISHAVHPDDIHILQSAIQEAMKTGDFEAEYRAVRPDGSVVWIADRGRVVKDIENEPARILGISADLTRRKLAEQALRDSEARLSAILQNTSAIIYMMDGDNRFLHVNRRFEEVFDRRINEVSGRSAYEVLPEEIAVMFDSNNRRALRERSAVEFEEEIWGRNGLRVYTTVRAPLLDSRARSSSIVAVSTDITDRKHLEDALRESDRRKDEFLATLAHELRNPLAPILYAAGVLDIRGPQTAELRWAVELIERQTSHMARLIDDLLDVSRITRNTLELRKQSVELSSIINAAADTTRPLIERGGIELSISMPGDPIVVDADPVRLGQVFSNLLNNAAKYRKSEKGGHIWLSVELDPGAVAVKVRDDGIGIPEAMLPHIFEMFTQVGKSMGQTEGGLGIGLSLAKRLTEMHGGTLEARSEGSGTGCEFIVRIPLLSRVNAGTGLSEAAPDESEAPRRRILVADDNPDIVESLALMLSLFGHDVQTAIDGVQAVEKAEQMRPDVVVLDIGMPRLNGYDAARRIRQMPWGAGMILVAVTGWGHEKDKRLSAEAGFNLHLVKPIDGTTILEALKSWNGSKMSHGKA
jgi:PAS domain S-box-containing protein